MVKVLLLALADHLNDDGLAWPALDTLAEECCVSRATIIRQLEKLVEKGYLSKEARSRKGSTAQTSNGYRFIHPAVTELQNDTLTASQNDTLPVTELQNDTGQSSKMQLAELQNDTRSLPQRTLPQDEPSSSSPSFPTVTSETIQIKSDAAPPKTKPKRTPPDVPPDVKAVCDRWIGLGLGPVSQNARRGLGELVAEHGREWVEAGLDKASAGNVRAPVSWLRTVIPGMKREQARGTASPYRNGSGPAPRDGPLSDALAADLAYKPKRRSLQEQPP